MSKESSSPSKDFEPKHIHFLGICGTAMGAVAAALARRGHIVTGTDHNVYPPMSTFLEEQGIKIFSGYHGNNIPSDAEYIVIGNAMSRGNPEVEEVLNRRLRYYSLPEILKDFFLQGKRNFVVTGTHGKTTTTSILTWLFEDAKLNPSFMIGGIARNLGCGGRLTDSEYCVLEGDEYDTAFFDKRSKFLHYLPEVAIINNIEFDHADIYDSLDEIKLTFSRLLKVIPGNGLALVNGDDKNCLSILPNPPCPVKTLGLGKHCDIRIKNITYTPESSSFTLNGGETVFTIPMIGEFNVRNAAMAVSAARFAGIPDESIVRSLASFEGIARRQEVYADINDIKIIDDFAHHPTAIKEAITGLRLRYPDQRLWVLFEPRSNTTRRKVFQEDLAESLALADISIIAQVENPEKVPENERLDVGQLVRDTAARGNRSMLGLNTEHIVSTVKNEALPGDVIVVMSNGGFNGILDKLSTALGK